MNRYTFLASMALIMALPCAAQNGAELASHSLTVEGDYNANTKHADKIQPTPEKIVMTRDRFTPTYITGQPAPAARNRELMTVLSEKSDRVGYPVLSGFASLGYGLRNVSDVKAALDWRPSDRDLVSADVILDGSNSVPDGWRQRILNKDFHLNYLHSFSSFNFEAGLEDYYSHNSFRPGESGSFTDDSSDSLMQKTGDVSFSMGAYSTGNGDIRWAVNTSFGNLTSKEPVLADRRITNRESLLRLGGWFSMPLDQGTAVFRISTKSAMYDWQGMWGDKYENFTTVTMSPSWSFKRDRLSASFGFNADFRTAVGQAFLMSPDVSVQYSFDCNVSVNAGAGGGLVDNSVRQLRTISPYWAQAGQTHDGYTVADIHVGADWTLPSYLWLGVKAGYSFTEDEIFQTALEDSAVVVSALFQDKARMVYAGAQLNATLSGRFDLGADICYRHWVGDYEDGVLAMKPALMAGISAHANICSGVNTTLAYRYVKYVQDGSRRMNAVNDLSLRADWNFRKDMTAFVSFGNLLGGNWQYWGGYRALKTYAVLGLSVSF